MPIGTSLGAYFADELHMHINKYLSDPPSTPDSGETSTDSIMDNKQYQPEYYKVDLLTKDRAAHEDKDPEEVASAALRYKDKVYTGGNHGIALLKLEEEYGHSRVDKPAYDFNDVEQGFTTNHGRFISREDAYELAHTRDQIRPGAGNFQLPDETRPGLLSEDLM